MFNSLGYRLVIICSNEEEEKSHFISKLHLSRRPFIPRKDFEEYKKYLSIHYTNQAVDADDYTSQYFTGNAASSVDPEQLVCNCHNNTKVFMNLFNLRSCVRFVTSDRSGMGKSLYIKRLAENLKFNLKCSDDAIHVTVPLHGPVVTADTLLELFKDHTKNQSCCIYHIDIAPNVS